MFIIEVKHKAKDILYKKIKKIPAILYVEKVKGHDLLIAQTSSPLQQQEIIIMESLIFKVSENDIINVHSIFPNKPLEGKTNDNKIFKFCFFDIDKTLTFGSTRFLDKDIDEIFYRMRQNQISIHFVSGRAWYDVKALTEKYELDPPYGAAENGGIVIWGSGLKHWEEIGDISNPLRFFEFIHKNGLKHARQDPRQMHRLTEIVILKEPHVPRDYLLRLQKLAHTQENIDVSILESPRAFHVTAIGIHKGTAINQIMDLYRKVGKSQEIISAGDSELDFPMFKISHKKYLMGNAEQYVKANVPKGVKILRGKYIDGVRQILADLVFN